MKVSALTKKTNKATMWVLTGESESSDDYGPLVFSEKPSQEELKRIAFSWDGDEDDEGPGDFGSFVYLTLDEIIINDSV